MTKSKIKGFSVSLIVKISVRSCCVSIGVYTKPTRPVSSIKNLANWPENLFAQSNTYRSASWYFFAFFGVHFYIHQHPCQCYCMSIAFKAQYRELGWTVYAYMSCIYIHTYSPVNPIQNNEQCSISRRKSTDPHPDRTFCDFRALKSTNFMKLRRISHWIWRL